MADETREIVTAGLQQWGIPYTERQIEQLAIYRDLLVEWNSTRMNLTRLISPREIAAEHFLDSISLLTVIDPPAGARLLDVGAGAGFPSLPLKIMRPDLHVTLLEGTAKKLTFCRAVADAADLKDVQLIHGRAEQQQPELRHRFDIVTARAVAHLDKLLPWCEPFAKPRTGIVAAFKGARAAGEVEEAEPTLRMMGMMAEIEFADIPGSEKTHALVLCRKGNFKSAHI